MASPAPAIRVRDLTVSLGGHRLIDRVTFDVPTGGTTAIIGPNGAGKSVLVQVILRLLPKTSGTVEIFGVPHEAYRRVAPLISYIPQRLAADRSLPLTVRGLFSLKSRRTVGLNPPDRERVQALLELVNMARFAHARFSTLSGGQQQRVLLAYSLMDKPRLLILDEPSAGIDVQGQETVYALLKRIQDEERLTLVLVSHELDVIMRYASQVLCLNQKLLCAGVPREVLSTDLLQQMYGGPVSHFRHTHAH